MIGAKILALLILLAGVALVVGAALVASTGVAVLLVLAGVAAMLVAWLVATNGILGG